VTATVPPLETLSDVLFRVAERYGDREDLLTIRRHRRTESLSAAGFVDTVRRTATALESHGVVKGDRVALFATNRPEWHVVDFACHLLGAVPVPIYPTLTAAQVAYILLDSGAGWVFYDDRAKRDLLAGFVPRDAGENGSEQQGLRLVALDADATAVGGTNLEALIGDPPPTRIRISRPSAGGSAATTRRASSTPRAPPAIPRASS